MLRPLINSILIALIATTIAITLASFTAYAIARLSFPGKRSSSAARWRSRCSRRSPSSDRCSTCGARWPLRHVPGPDHPVPDVRAAAGDLHPGGLLREIPWDLEQAAQVDGATPFQAFRRVILPLAAPGVFTAAILVFIFAWNDFVFAISLTSSNNSRTVPAAIAFFTGESQFTSPTGNIAAAAVLVTIPIIIFVLIFQRRIVAGLTAGAVKG